MNAIWLILPVLTLPMLQLGLTPELKDFRLLLRRPLPVVIGLFGHIL